MNSKWIGLVVLVAVLLSFSVAIAGPGRVLIEGDKLIFRDGSGNEYVQSPGSTVTAGTVTVSGGGGSPVTTTGTETLTNKTLTSPTIDAPVLNDGTDTQIYISNSAGEMMPVTMSGNATITNAGVVSLVPAAEGEMLIFNSPTLGWETYTMSGDATLSNTGALTIGSNKIGTAETNFNTVTLAVAAGVLYNSVSVETGSTFLGWRTGTEGVLGNTSVFVNTVSWSDPTLRISYSDEQIDLGFSTLIMTFVRP